MASETFFKPQYGKEEIQELIAWFEDSKKEFPQTLRINDCTVAENLPSAIKSLLVIAKTRMGQSAFSGYIAHLMLIRHLLQEQGF